MWSTTHLGVFVGLVTFVAFAASQVQNAGRGFPSAFNPSNIPQIQLNQGPPFPGKPPPSGWNGPPQAPGNPPIGGWINGPANQLPPPNDQKPFSEYFPFLGGDWKSSPDEAGSFTGDRTGFTTRDGIAYYNGETCLLVLKRQSEATCITSGSVNRAIFSILGTSFEDELPRPKENTLDPNYISHIGTLLLRVTRLLAKWYRIPPHMIRRTLPLIETAFTNINGMCPSFLKPDFKMQCVKSAPFRTINGLCNNLENPGWGALHAPYRREAPAVYEDGIECPKGVILCKSSVNCSVYDFDSVPHPYATYLPSPRTISTAIHSDNHMIDNLWTNLVVAFGQIVDHDITGISLTGEAQCCGAARTPHRDCFPIFVDRDPFYMKHKQSCLNFARSRPGLSFQCKLGAREAINAVTSYLDGSFLYGCDSHREDAIRARKGGELKMWDRFSDRHLQPLLPLNTVDDPDSDCMRPTKTHLCFLGGDVRANFHPTLTVVHTLFARVHNSFAKSLRTMNPHWDDERLFQEARRITIAVLQHITYKEFLPTLIGRGAVKKYGIVPLEKGYYNGYDPKTDASIWMAFITAAFRVGHSLIPPDVTRYSATHTMLAKIGIHETLTQPWELMKPGFFDTFVCGLMNQPCAKFDSALTDNVRNHLFAATPQGMGDDLAARNIQRGRDHGLPGYTAYRRWCGLKPVTSWMDLVGVMPNTSIARLSNLYRNVHDIDLFTGGLCEPPLPIALAGETFACIIGNQFKDIRDGDRFWYENGGQVGSFTPPQLQEIRKMSMSRVLCDFTDNLVDIQVDPFFLYNPKENPRFPCSNMAVFPRLDLRPWIERLPINVPFLKEN